MFVESIFRYPIKSVGSENLDSVVLETNKTLPWDRYWGITHERSLIKKGNKSWFNPNAFARCYNFKAFSAISNKFNEKSGQMLLKHPNLNDIKFNIFKKDDFSTLIFWLQNLCTENFPKPVDLFPSEKFGFTDTNYPSISLNFIASLNTLSEYSGSPISKGRFRGNIWIKNSLPWQELEMINKRIKIGKSVLQIIEPIVRCRTTEFSDKTGLKDFEILKMLSKFNNEIYFGVYCKVLNEGKISVNDEIIILD